MQGLEFVGSRVSLNTFGVSCLVSRCAVLSPSACCGQYLSELDTYVLGLVAERKRAMEAGTVGCTGQCDARDVHCMCHVEARVILVHATV